jgi:hypothetical protein
VIGGLKAWMVGSLLAADRRVLARGVRRLQCRNTKS